LQKTKIDDFTPAPASAGVNLSPRKRGAGVQDEKAGFPLEFIPHTMRGGNPGTPGLFPQQELFRSCFRTDIPEILIK